MKMLIALLAWLALANGAPAQVSVTGAGCGVGTTCSGAPPAYTGPGDVVSGADFYLGLRAYNAATAGAKAVNVCLPLDATCADFSTNATTGALTIVAITGTSCNNTTVICTIKTFYDQITASTLCGGGPCNQTATTIANRLKLVVPGAANGCPSTSVPCGIGTSTTVYDNQTTYNQPIPPFSWSWVGERVSGTTGFYAINSSGGQSGTGFDGSANKVFLFCGGTSPKPAQTTGTWSAIEAVQTTTTNGTAVVDGSATSGTSASCSVSTGYFKAFQSLGDPAQFVELGGWHVAFNSTQYGNMNTNQHSFWGF